MESEKAIAKNTRLHAVLAGCNYPNMSWPGELRGTHNDVKNMRNTLITRFRCDPRNVVSLIDEPGTTAVPTKRGIEDAITAMIRKARPGDTLLFFFAGHGMLHKSDLTGRLEPNIITCEANIMNRMEFRVLVNMVPRGVTFTIVSDSCNSGGLIDKEPIQVGGRQHLQDKTATVVGIKPRMVTYESYLAHLTSVTGLDSPDIGVHLLHIFGEEASLMYRLSPDRYPKPLQADQGILLSGCQEDESSYEDPDANGGPCGDFTKVVQQIVKERRVPISNKELVIRARRILGDPQHPCLYCSKENADAPFLGKPAHKFIGESSQDA